MCDIVALSKIWWDYFCWKKEPSAFPFYQKVQGEWNLWLTRSASIEASSHGNMSIPRDYKDSEEARTDCWAQFVRDNSVSVAVTTEYLMIRKIIRCECQIMLVYLLRAGFNWGKFFLQFWIITLCTFLKKCSSFLSGDHGFDLSHLSPFLCAISYAAHWLEIKGAFCGILLQFHKATGVISLLIRSYVNLNWLSGLSEPVRKLETQYPTLTLE